MTPLPCIICHKPLEAVANGYDQPYEATMVSTGGSYGSTIFDPMDGTYLTFNLCDDCLTEAAKAHHVRVGRARRPVVVISRRGYRTIVGWEELDRPEIEWTGPDMEGWLPEDEVSVELTEIGTYLGRNITWTEPADVLREEMLADDEGDG